MKDRKGHRGMYPLPANSALEKFSLRAELCRQRAAKATNAAEQAQWIIFAERWRRFAEEEKHEAAARFMVLARGLAGDQH